MVYRLRRAVAVSDSHGPAGLYDIRLSAGRKTDGETRYGEIFCGGFVEKTNENDRLDVGGVCLTGHGQRNNKSAGIQCFRIFRVRI